MTKTRFELKRLYEKLHHIDIGYTTEAITEIRDVLYRLIGFVEMALPEDKSDDD